MALSEYSNSSNHPPNTTLKPPESKHRVLSRLHRSHLRPKLPLPLPEHQRLNPLLVPLPERKRMALSILSTSPLNAPNRAKVEAYVATVQTAARGNKSALECWFHAPWVAKPGDKRWRTHTISKAFTFRFAFARIHVGFHYGVWALLCAGPLSDEAQKGLVEVSQDKKVTWKTEGYDLSHLCGSWVCCNPAHLVAERRRVNMERKRCHRMARCVGGKGGEHEPRCVVGVQLASRVLGNRRDEVVEEWDSDC
ncbi:hypothetical protein EJ05DRAFT_501103 [Pseudovirgaria hyperparasitica]|uniref:Zinc-binding loop region of homing endonuclease domain-containing protein n=1 Tax=Pseudovirgaria hyperparasitica TaxID=470096 RepID=A0A6A6W4M9_9PEZI|nr:uncharacterized protein EJ05DRAFT_501103 [Pseudovirgaria hyperparasitica]KAF2757573.1 hypothetical protein EJ05DRAFT_501103 [Pseudovirgaria hyperparasitica]